MAQDNQTLRFYAREAAAYTSRNQAPIHSHIEAFLSSLPAGAAILELGCGGGRDSAFMISKGFNVCPTDGTPEIAAAAERRLGIPVATLLFGELDAESRFDGIWANACLLHVPRIELSSVLARIHSALKVAGRFYASFKAGDIDGRDQFCRYYNYPSKDWLRELYAAFAWESVSIEADRGGGYDKKPTDWLHVTTIKQKIGVEDAR